MELYNVEIVYIGRLDRTLSSEKCLNFVKSLSNYNDMVAGIGMDCEENGHPCIKHLDSYQEAKKMGMFLTAHAGEDGSDQNIWDALLKLKVNRIDHGCRAAYNDEILDYLSDNKILCAMCPSSNVYTGAAESFEDHPFLKMMRAGVPVSISSDDPPYMCELVQELGFAIEKMGLSEDELIKVVRNGFEYSISGQKYLGAFDDWVRDFKLENF